MTSESLDLAKTQYQSAKRAFERGEYRQSVEYLQKAISLANPNSSLGGEMQTWLVTAYEASGQTTEAIDLCERLSKHPDLKTRQQGTRLLYILKAPKLKTRPEWLTQIPDLTRLTDGDGNPPTARYVSPTPKPARKAKPEEPIDWSQINTRDNRFVWFALVGALLTIGILIGLS